MCEIKKINSLSILLRILEVVQLFQVAISSTTEDLKNNGNENCTHPEIFFRFFNETVQERKGPPPLYNVSSRDMIEKPVMIPYQYFLINCKAPYPILWEESVTTPPDYFAPILDEEIRSIESENETEIFIYRKHVGNETLANATEISMTCETVERGTKSCGGTLINIKKYDPGSSMLGVTFASVDSSLNQIMDLNSNESHCLSLDVKVQKPSHDIDESIYFGDKVNVNCISSLKYFAQGMRIDLSPFKVLKNGENHERYNLTGGYRNMSIVMSIDRQNQNQNESIQAISCKAPVRKSWQWENKTVDLKVKPPEHIKFIGSNYPIVNNNPPEVQLVCKATGRPLPYLIWSSSNFQNITENYTTTIAPDLSWISSTLIFPNKSFIEAELYFCTARNRLGESVHRRFKNEESSTLPFPSLVAVIVLALALVGVIIFLGWKLKLKTDSMRLFTKTEIEEFLFGKPELLLGEDNYEEINSYAAYLPYDKNQFEIKREELEFDSCDVLGSGAFGTVYKGIFKNSKGFSQTVAIKTVNESSDKIYFATLLSEIKIMCYIGHHENVVQLIGACTKYLYHRQIFVATEFCLNGDLLSYIQKHGETFKNNMILTNEQQNKRPINESYCRLASAKRLLSPHLLLVWAHQISQGMVFLSSKKVIHGDLAARNILLTHNLTAKIGDFGLSKRMQNYSNYVRKDEDLVPWRHLAIECLQFMKFSISSDVWSFGIVLWELFSLGQVPYASYNFSEIFIVSLCHGERLLRPCHADQKMYNLMLECWNHYPQERPSFQCIENILKIWVFQSESHLLEPAKPKPIETEVPSQNQSDLKQSNAEDNFGKTIPNDYVTTTSAPITSSSSNDFKLGSPNESLLEATYVNQLPTRSSSLLVENAYVDWDTMRKH